MAFQRINLTARINNMPMNIRKTVLMSLVGSLNATLVGAADVVAQRCVADGYELRELTARDVDTLLQAVDFQGNTTRYQLVQIQQLRDEWQAMLASTADDDKLGDIAGTIEMMVGKQRLRPVAANAAKLLASVGVEVTAEELEATRAARRDADQLRANDRAERRGFIEWALEHCFSVTDDGTEADEADYFGALSTETQETLVNKTCAALNKAITTATQNVLMGTVNPNALGLADITLLRAEAAEIIAKAYPKVVEPVEQADAPGPKARRVKKEATA